MRIFKYVVPITDPFTLTMPEGARILAVQVQYGLPVMWAVVNPDAKREDRKFRLVGTGHDIEPKLDCSQYIGTFQMEGGQLVLHVFEEGVCQLL